MCCRSLVATARTTSIVAEKAGDFPCVSSQNSLGSAGAIFHTPTSSKQSNRTGRELSPRLGKPPAKHESDERLRGFSRARRSLERARKAMRGPEQRTGGPKQEQQRAGRKGCVGPKARNGQVKEREVPTWQRVPFSPTNYAVPCTARQARFKLRIQQ